MAKLYCSYASSKGIYMVIESKKSLSGQLIRVNRPPN